MSEKRVFRHPAAGERLDRFLSERCAELSRSRIKRLIADGAVLVDGREVNAGYRLRDGQIVAMRAPDPEPTSLVAQSIPLDVLHEDDELLVVNKPAGMPVHPGAGHPDSTLVNAALGLSAGIEGVGGAGRAGLVHRLDMDTSGVIVVAKTERAHANLSAQFKARTVRKRYVALVRGWPDPPEAVIEAPIGRDPENRKRMAIVEGGARVHHAVPDAGAIRGRGAAGSAAQDGTDAPDSCTLGVRRPSGNRRRDLRRIGERYRTPLPARGVAGVRASGYGRAGEVRGAVSR